MTKVLWSKINKIIVPSYYKFIHKFQNSIKLGTIILLIYFSDPPGIQWVTRRVSLGKKKPPTLDISGLKRSYNKK
jgi:hypothetical protein